MTTANVGAEWVGGDLLLKDKSGNTIAKVDGTNRAVDIVSGSALKIAGTSVNPLGATSAGKLLASGAHTVTAGNASANSATIATGLTSIASMVVQVLDSGNNVVTADADVTASGGNLVVADGATYNTTAGYVIHWLAFGA